jgi:hypothetical protein
MKTRVGLLFGFAASIALAAGSAAQAAPHSQAGRCATVIAQERAYDASHHLFAKHEKGRCTPGPKTTGPSPRMFSAIMCHPNSRGNFCCVWEDDRHSPHCGYST